MDPKIDKRFSDPEAEPTPWAEALGALEQAELYWITTVRPDGRPHVTPLIGVAADEAVYFCTGLEEQKGRNLEHNDHVALTTGNNTWASGLDVVVEGQAVRDHRRRGAAAPRRGVGGEVRQRVALGGRRRDVPPLGRRRGCGLQDRAGEGPRVREGPARPDDVSVLTARRLVRVHPHLPAPGRRLRSSWKW